MLEKPEKSQLPHGFLADVVFSIRRLAVLNYAVCSFADYDWNEELAHSLGEELKFSKVQWSLGILNEFTECFCDKDLPYIANAFSPCKGKMEEDYDTFIKAIFDYTHSENRTDKSNIPLVRTILQHVSSTFAGLTHAEASNYLENFVDVYLDMFYQTQSAANQ